MTASPQRFDEAAVTAHGTHRSCRRSPSSGGLFPVAASMGGLILIRRRLRFGPRPNLRGARMLTNFVHRFGASSGGLNITERPTHFPSTRPGFELQSALTRHPPRDFGPRFEHLPPKTPPKSMRAASRASRLSRSAGVPGFSSFGALKWTRSTLPIDLHGKRCSTSLKHIPKRKVHAASPTLAPKSQVGSSSLQVRIVGFRARPLLPLGGGGCTHSSMPQSFLSEKQ